VEQVHLAIVRPVVVSAKAAAAAVSVVVAEMDKAVMKTGLENKLHLLKRKENVTAEKNQI
jgi:hypothetical protein